MNLPAFGVRQPVPINLLMVGIIIAGSLAAVGLRREFFPEMDSDSLVVVVAYPGASPDEVETAVATRIENAVAEVDEVGEIRTRVSEGTAKIIVKFREGTQDMDEATDEVRRSIDAIKDLPADIERPRVTRIEPSMPVIMAELWGDAEPQGMKQAIQDIRDDLRSLPGMGTVELSGTRDDELSVEVDRDVLVEYGLSITDVADRVTAWMQEVPGGTMRSSSGDVAVRTQGPDESSFDMAEIILAANGDGSVLRLGDLASIRTTLVDRPLKMRFNGKPAVGVVVNKSGKQDIVKIAKMTRAYVDGRMRREFEQSLGERFSGRSSARQLAWELGNSRPTLPGGTTLTTFTDLARFVEGRLALLTQNAIYGAALVFCVLLLVLNWRVAFWVGVGLVTALSGTLAIMAGFGITLNLLTMFGLIVVLGLLVDDAIVVAENIKARHDRGEPAMESAVKGANEVLWPVVATVLTSIVAFLPLTFIKGNIGDLLGALPIVVACALAMSLFEASIILPGHLGHSLEKGGRRATSRPARFVRAYEAARDRVIFERLVPAYLSILRLVIRYRYVSLAIAIASLVVSMGMVAGGRVGYQFMEIPDAETIAINVRMPVGTPIAGTDSMVRVIEDAAASHEQVKTVNSLIGVQIQIDSNVSSISANVGQLFIELTPAEDRELDAKGVIDLIRNSIGDSAALADRITYEMMAGGPSGPDITIQLRGDDESRMAEASKQIQQDLLAYSNVHDVGDDAARGQRELKIELRPGAATSGLTVANLARQVRGAVYGIDSHVFARDGEEVDVRVKMDEDMRQDLGELEQLWITAPDGRAMPLVEVASITESDGYSTINRVDRRRAVTVTAEAAVGTSPESVIRSLPIAQWRHDYPDIGIRFGGRQQQESDAFSTLPIGFAAACLMIYVILAWLFGSYFQPLMVMLGIPFAMIGVIWGHYFTGYSLSFLSMIGFVALSGVVVNDSLIFVEFYNTRRKIGDCLSDAIVAAGSARLRPIFLTTITTVLGLTPLMLEQSMQARFLIPMAVAISFGLMGATVLILLLLPALIVIGADLRSLTRFLWFGSAEEPRQQPPVPDHL